MGVAQKGEALAGVKECLSALIATAQSFSQRKNPLPCGSGFSLFWWRFRDSNPGPADYDSAYMCIDGCWLVLVESIKINGLRLLSGSGVLI
jgi:hypothetical protein